MTTSWTAQLFNHFPPTIVKLDITNVNIRIKFTEALIQCTGKCSKVKELMLSKTKFGDDKKGQELGVQLAEVILSSNNIKKYSCGSHTSS